MPDEHVDRAVADDLRTADWSRAARHELEKRPSRARPRSSRSVARSAHAVHDLRAAAAALPAAGHEPVSDHAVHSRAADEGAGRRLSRAGRTFPKLLRADDDGTLHFADELFGKVDSVRLLKLDDCDEAKRRRRGPTDAAAARSRARRRVRSGRLLPARLQREARRRSASSCEVARRRRRSTRRKPTTRPRRAEPGGLLQHGEGKVAARVRSAAAKCSTSGATRSAGRTWRAAICRRRRPSRSSSSNHDVAEKDERDAALWSKILPFLLLIWALTGAFYPAVDLCAGEKERGTLETLLSSPAERIEIVWGKLLTVMLFSVVTAVLNMLSMGITGSIVPEPVAELRPAAAAGADLVVPGAAADVGAVQRACASRWRRSRGARRKASTT